MKQKKPDIFLGITMVMLVLAAVLCVAILLAQKAGKKAPADNTLSTSQATKETKDAENNTNPSDPDNNKPNEGGNPVNSLPLTGDKIDTGSLKKDLDNKLNGLRSEWQVVVFDCANSDKVESAWIIEDANKLMKTASLIRLFVMADVYQQIKDGAIQEAEVIDDLTAMITKSDKAAGDRLVEVLGGGDASKGREHVKAFAQQKGFQIGFNRAFSASSGSYNYVSARSAATLLNKIVHGECVSPEHDQKMVDLLFAAEANEINLGIDGEGVTKGFVCDVQEGFSIGAAGIVNNGTRTYVVCVISNEIKSMDSGKKIIAEVFDKIEPYFAK